MKLGEGPGASFPESLLFSPMPGRFSGQLLNLIPAGGRHLLWGRKQHCLLLVGLENFRWRFPRDQSQCGAKYRDFNVGPAASQIAHNAKPSGSSLLLAFHGATQATLRDLGSGLLSPTEPRLALPTAQCPQLRVVFCLQVLPQGWLSDSQEKAQTDNRDWAKAARSECFLRSGQGSAWHLSR